MHGKLELILSPVVGGLMDEVNVQHIHFAYKVTRHLSLRGSTVI